MKILIIPDVHGTTHWKNIFLDHIKDVDGACFLGDYVDGWNESEKEEAAALNFEDIVNTTASYKNINILLGNHDISYIYQYNGAPEVSGHQTYMTERYNDMFIAAKDRLSIIAKYDKWVVSHAGVSKTWYKNTLAVYQVFSKRNGIKPPSGPINLANWMWEQGDLSQLNFSDYCWDPSGDNAVSSPLWIRPNSLLKDAYFPNQIVGHTEVKVEKPILFTHNKNNVILVDCASHNRFLILDTENDAFVKNQCQEFNV